MFRRRHSRKAFFALLLFAVIVASCAPAGGDLPVAATSGPTSKIETAVPSRIDASVESLAPASPEPSLLAGQPIYSSDSMWALLASAAEGSRRAESLQGAVDFAEVIVVGRYIGLERGAVYGRDATAVALVQVDAVAKGRPKLGPDGLLRIEFVLVVGSGLYPARAFADLERSVPSDSALLFLFTWDRYLDMIGGGFPAFEARDDLDRIYKTIGGDGAIPVVEDRLAPSSFAEGWPTDLRAIELDPVLAGIRASSN